MDRTEQSEMSKMLDLGEELCRVAVSLSLARNEMVQVLERDEVEVAGNMFAFETIEDLMFELGIELSLAAARDLLVAEQQETRFGDSGVA